MRVLEAHDIPYQPMYYDVVEHLSAAEVAEVLGIAPEQTFKTLVALSERAGARPMLALVPGDSQLNLKKLAQASGEKRVQMAPHRDAERLTGLEKGGISPLALMDKSWAVFIDETAQLFGEIEISAGKVGIGVLVPVPPLVALLHATFSDLTG